MKQREAMALAPLGWSQALLGHPSPFDPLQIAKAEARDLQVKDMGWISPVLPWIPGLTVFCRILFCRSLGTNLEAHMADLRQRGPPL